MDWENLRILCNCCDVHLDVETPGEDRSRVQCPVCGKDFGTWQQVRGKIPRKIGEAFRDRDSWRAAPMRL